jgi:signal transduction histidine kinase
LVLSMYVTHSTRGLSVRDLILRAIDYFVPEEITRDQASLTSVRAFILLHLLGPAMGHSVVLFLWTASPVLTWQFWVVEVGVASFWLIPLLVKTTRSLLLPAMVSVQTLVFLSLFGSFFYGGISSPFMPWLIIALLLGFFYLAARAKMVLAGVSAQLALFVGARLLHGNFPVLLPMSSLTYVNLISIMAAITYTTLLSVYYETMMRDSGLLEQATRVHRMQTEALGEAMRQAEQASREKSIFLAKISHELRTPLNAVIGYSEMLRDELPAASASDQRAVDLERINVAGRHLLALVTEVLDLKSIEGASLDATLQKVEISQLIRDVTATAGPLVAKKRNQLIIQMATDLGAIETDPLKLRQSILNLLSNAAKFTSHGVIRLNVTRRKLDSGERLIIEVHDTGIGMSPEGLSRIFKNFVQSEQDTTQKFGGTGLGLALTKRFCTLMGGTVSVTSQPRQGSTFVIDIPYKSADDDLAAAPKAAIRAIEASAA